uniref:Uncharacterized protein n=1 Tax=Setaria italica TaxID=4555 RepID=K3YX05_SETIT
MKDLIEFSHKNNLGPKESLNSYSKTIAKFQNMHDSRQLMAAASLANNQSNTKVMGVQQEASALSMSNSPGLQEIMGITEYATYCKILYANIQATLIVHLIIH